MSANTLHGWVQNFRKGLWDISTGLPAKAKTLEAVCGDLYQTPIAA
jgi:hypothetical protein